MKPSMQAGCLAIAATFLSGSALAQAPEYTDAQTKASTELIQVGCSGDVLTAFSGKPDSEETNAEGGDPIVERTYGENLVAYMEKDKKVLATVVRDAAKAPEAYKKYLGVERETLESTYGLPHVEFNLLSAVSYGSETGEVRMVLEGGKVTEISWNCGAAVPPEDQPESQ